MPDKFDDMLRDTEPDEKKKKNTLKKNNIAISHFTMTFMGDGLLCMLEEMKTPEFPGGIAWQLWSDIMDEYRPNNTI